MLRVSLPLVLLFTALAAPRARAESPPYDARPAAMPTLRVADVRGKEGNAGLTPFTFRIKLDPPAAVPVSVEVTALPSGTNPQELQFSPTQLVFAPGETEKPYVVNVVADTVPEVDESFQIIFSNVMNALAETGGAGAIVEDDDGIPPTLSMSDPVVVDEGNSGVKEVQLTVRLAPATDHEVIVDWWAEPETGTSHDDFTPITPTPITFAVGEKEKTIVLGIVGDTLPEPDERIRVEIGQEQGAALGMPRTTVTIRNDDGPLLDAAVPLEGGAEAGVSVEAGATVPGDAGVPGDAALADATVAVADAAPTPADAAAVTPTPAPQDKTGGCHCRMGGRGRAPWPVLLLLALVWRRRRR